jgi:5-methylcytosine-specific restriction endonuclease McrA
MNDPIGNFKPRLAPKPKPNSHLVYGRKRWRQRRKAKLQNNPICEHCRRELAIDVDHVDGDNTNNAASNLQSLCKKCHGKKTKQQDNPS